MGTEPKPPRRAVAHGAISSALGAGAAAALFGGFDATMPAVRVLALVAFALVLGATAGAIIAALWGSGGD